MYALSFNVIHNHNQDKMSVNTDMQKHNAGKFTGTLVESDPLEDAALIEQISNGDHAAFSQLVERHSERFYALAWRMTSNDQDAEDVVQDCFLKLWNTPDLFDPSKGTKFTTWFYRIVSNRAIDHIRKRKKTVGTEDFDWIESEQAGQLQDYQDQQQQVLLEQAIAELPDKQKLALNLCFYEGLSNKEAAEVIGVGVKALESLLMRAKSKLKDNLARRGVI